MGFQGIITVKSPLDYEARDEYSLIISAATPSGLSAHAIVSLAYWMI
jgi:hypothetical protein